MFISSFFIKNEIINPPYSVRLCSDMEIVVDPKHLVPGRILAWKLVLVMIPVLAMNYIVKGKKPTACQKVLVLIPILPEIYFVIIKTLL